MRVIYSAFQIKGFFTYIIIFTGLLFLITKYYEYTAHHIIATRILLKNEYTDISLDFFKYKDCKKIEHTHGTTFKAKDSYGEVVKGAVCSNKYGSKNEIIVF